jgi:ankyrin repeat protein
MILAVLLIENGADLNVQDKDQLWSPLMHSISNNNETILLKLIEKNCDVNKVDIDGNNALHLAVLSENEYFLKYLLKMDPNKNVLNNENQTPLDLAKLSEDEIIINILSQ